MKKRRLPLLVLASALALAASRMTQGPLAAQTRPMLADYFTTIPLTVIDAGYVAQGAFTATGDINGDGYQDLIALGNWNPGGGVTCCTPQPGRVYLGDGDGHFSRAPASLFPVDTLLTVNPRKVLFADFNADGRPDMFVSSTGWDADPFPGEQNRLYLSRPDGGWRDATANLPQISDFSHTSAAADISGRGLIDIFVGNGYFSERVAPYFLLNTGSGQFTLTRTNIPAGNNQLLTAVNFAGATLTDLNGDGLAELIVTADSLNGRSTILWNRAGTFSAADMTELPPPRTFGNAHIDLDVQRIDVNQDGLPDLVLVGTQQAPAFYDGWFVQVLVNKGNRQFVDETALRLPPGEASGGREGLNTGSPWAKWVRVLDFNQDGAPDFVVDFNPRGLPQTFRQDQPLVWLNDGAGYFTTLKAGDFVSAGSERLVFGGPRLIATRFGYSFIGPEVSPSDGGLKVRGLLATRPFPTVGRPSDLTASSSGSTVTLSWRPPPPPPLPAGSVTAYMIEAGSSSGASNLARLSTGTTATTFSASGAGAGTYFVRVRAITGIGNSAASNEAQLVVEGGCGSAPGAPGTPSVTTNSGGTVVLTWTAATGSPAAYIIEAGTAAGLSNLAVTDVGSVTTLTATAVGTGTYYVRVKARNACGTSASGELTLVVG